MLVQIEKIINGGYGLARTESGVCLIQYAVPGDILDVECSDEISPCICWIKRIEKRSVHRIEPECPNFEVCGGCDFQNIDYMYEIEIKKNIVMEDLRRIARIEVRNLNILSSSSYHYRNNVQFKTDEKGNVGFFRKKSNEVVPIPDGENGCLIIDKRINDFIRELKSNVNFKKGGFRVRTNREGKIYKKGIPGVESDRYCNYSASGVNYRIGIDDFFQINNYLYEDWLKLIIEYIEPAKDDTIVDLFAGSGFITIPLAKKSQYVIGMEVNGSAVKNARYNSIVNGVNNIVFKRVDVNRGFHLKGKITKAVIDPPRSGMSRQLIDELVKYSPELITYVSCNTATFSRDIGIFYQKGYSIDKISMVDLFPRTAHIEVVARLIK